MVISEDLPVQVSPHSEYGTHHDTGNIDLALRVPDREHSDLVSTPSQLLAELIGVRLDSTDVRWELGGDYTDVHSKLRRKAPPHIRSQPNVSTRPLLQQTLGKRSGRPLT